MPEILSKSSIVPILTHIFGLARISYHMFHTESVITDRHRQSSKTQPFKYQVLVIPTLWTAEIGTVHRIMIMEIATIIHSTCFSMQSKTRADMKQFWTVLNVDVILQQSLFQFAMTCRLETSHPESIIITVANEFTCI